MTIVETTCSVTAGVDTHADVHVVAVVDQVGGVLGIETFDTTATGCRQLLEMAARARRDQPRRCRGHRVLRRRPVPALTRAGIRVVEVDRPNRQVRRREGKSDPVDAVVAARAALSGQALGHPKSRDGDVEAIRVLEVACRSATEDRIATLNQLRHLVICADDQVRSRFAGLSVARLTAEAAGLRPRPTDTVRYSTLFAMRTLGRRVAALDAELVELKSVMRPLIDRTAPGLLSMYGVGYDVAAKLLVAAGDNPERLRSEAAFALLCGVAPLEASSGKTVRHRLNRGGNRQANKALYHVVITRMAPISRPRTTSRGDEPRASRPARSSASSSATSPAKRSSTSGRRHLTDSPGGGLTLRTGRRPHGLFDERTVDRRHHAPPRGP